MRGVVEGGGGGGCCVHPPTRGGGLPVGASSGLAEKTRWRPLGSWAPSRENLGFAGRDSAKGMVRVWLQYGKDMAQVWQDYGKGMARVWQG